MERLENKLKELETKTQFLLEASKQLQDGKDSESLIDNLLDLAKDFESIVSKLKIDG
ncbi:MAG TPA: hypothetical protein VFV86_02530 [Nitrososphaeraceae archaeon]|nr:hypothetical protein [Nitrososphaeraceae archaeon]